MPGPNDHNAVITKDLDGKEHVHLEPGLGADEPTEEQRATGRAAALARIELARAQVAKAAEEVEHDRAELNTERAALDEMRAEINAKLAELRAAESGESGE